MRGSLLSGGTRTSPLACTGPPSLPALVPSPQLDSTPKSDGSGLPVPALTSESPNVIPVDTATGTLGESKSPEGSSHKGGNAGQEFSRLSPRPSTHFRSSRYSRLPSFTTILVLVGAVVCLRLFCRRNVKPQ
ncbi:uncharacterized protein LOC143301385 isoform X2 [Babylonia areolata]